jgi:hypothetical protein
MNTVAAKQIALTQRMLLEAVFAGIHRHGFQAASIAQILIDTRLTNAESPGEFVFYLSKH